MPAQLLVQTGGHDRDFACLDFIDILASDPNFLIDSGGQQDLVRSILPDQAIMGFPILEGDKHRLVAADKAGAGENNRLQQVAFGADFPNIGEVRPHVATEIANGVTRGTGCFRAVENRLTAANISLFHTCQQLLQLGVLLGVVSLQRGVQFLRRRLDRGWVFSQERLHAFGPQAGTRG